MSMPASKLISSITKLCTSHHISRIILSSNTRILEQQSLISQSLEYRYLSNYIRMHNHNTHRRNFSVHGSVQPAGAPLPSQPPSSPMRWILGTVLAIILPFAGNKWGPLLEFKQDVDTVVESIEEIVEVVGKVAEVVDKVAEDISDGLPEGGKIKKVMEIVEDVAEKTAKDAQTVGNAIDKFQEVEENVENIVVPLNDKANEHPKEAKL